MRKIILIMIAINLTNCGFSTVNEGYRGIQTTFGKLDGEPLEPGLHFYNPFKTSVFKMEVREQKQEYKTHCFTKDTQSVEVEFVVTYYPVQTKIADIYVQFGRNWDEKIVAPAIVGSVKDAIGQYIADDLVSKREEVKAFAEKEIMDALEKRNVIVTRLDITDLNFQPAFQQAVEAKVVAIQRALESKNKTVEIDEQAKQKILSATAEAESMKIKTKALAQSKALVEYEAIQKWDGKLPEIMLGNGSTPFIDLRGKNNKF